MHFVSASLYSATRKPPGLKSVSTGEISIIHKDALLYEISRKPLQTALTEAADTIGKAGEYASGMKEYARASTASKLAAERLSTVVKATSKAVGVGAGGALGWKLLGR
jgi:hypothetical protein